MIKYIKNISGSQQTWLGKVLEDNEYHQISDSNAAVWATNDDVLTALAVGDAVMAKSNDGTQDLSGTSANIAFLRNLIPPEIMTTTFAAKNLPDGRRLFMRVRGVSAVVSGTPDNIDFIVPYAACKINAVEIINCEIGDKVDFEVYDNPSGTISGVPDAKLNQFGFSVNMTDKFYSHKSNYDADLIKDMKVRLVYDAINSDMLPKTIYINFILHEVVS